MFYPLSIFDKKEGIVTILLKIKKNILLIVNSTICNIHLHHNSILFKKNCFYKDELRDRLYETRATNQNPLEKVPTPAKFYLEI
jgi:hypothetical protein